MTLLALLTVPVGAVSFSAQTAAPSSFIGRESYLTPPAIIRNAVLAPWYKNLAPGSISPDGSAFLSLERDGLVSLAKMGKAHVNLGGLEIDTKAMRERALTTRSAKGIRVMDLVTKKLISVEVPEGARVSDAKWSPDGKWIAYFAHFDEATRLYVADPKTGKSRLVTKHPVMPTLCNTFEWTDGNELVAVFRPDTLMAEPVAPDVASTPRVQVSDEKTHQIVSYPTLLETPYDQARYEYYGTGQLAIVDAESGQYKLIGKPQMIDTFSAAPTGEYFRVSVVQKPFSYFVPVSRFGERDLLIDAEGKEIAELDKRPLRLGAPDESKPKDDAKRGFQWFKEGLAFLQLAPTDKDKDKDKEKPAGKRKDRLVLWNPPFTETSQQTLFESETRLGSVRFGTDGKALFITQTVEGKTRLSATTLGGTAKPVTLQETGPDDDAADLVTGRGGFVRVTGDGKSAYLSGTKYAKDPLKEAPKPFIDRVDLESAKREKVFESSADTFETATLLTNDGTRMLVTRQSPQKIAQTYLVDKSAKSEAPITENKDYLPDLTGARREIIVVTRADGFKFQVKVTMPRFTLRNPAFFWMYPSEFTSQEEYDKSKRTYNKNLFPVISANNKEILIRAGYVVVEPDVPIVGPKGRMNDEYVPQLRNSLSAVIDELSKREWIDRSRIGIGGHSYGAFSTMNALIHTPFFKCGIAGDGCYLRPLTPYSFQNESRPLWEARETYLDMSPLLYAERITGAVLMYHGLEDQNVGTSPINSQRMFGALQALGKPSALIMYPYEDHGQIAEQSILDQWARFTAWLDKYLKP